MKPRRPRWWRDPPPPIWGGADEFKYGLMPRAMMYQGTGKSLPIPPPDRALVGFSLFPKRQSKRAADADRALRKFGLLR